MSRTNVLDPYNLRNKAHGRHLLCHNSQCGMFFVEARRLSFMYHGGILVIESGNAIRGFTYSGRGHYQATPVTVSLTLAGPTNNGDSIDIYRDVFGNICVPDDRQPEFATVLFASPGSNFVAGQKTSYANVAMKYSKAVFEIGEEYRIDL